MKKVLIYKRFERFWHWSQGLLIIFLGFTGFEVHGSFHFFGFKTAVNYHRFAAYALLGLIVFAVFWHFTTGEWRQYIPNLNNLTGQVWYYLKGIFQGADPPIQKTGMRKFNPIQAIVYLGFKLLLVPLTVLSGLALLFHKTLDRNEIVVIRDISLGNLAFWHVLCSFGLLSFGIIHVYMTSTGRTPFSNLKVMITGYEEEGEDKPAVRKQRNPPTLRTLAIREGKRRSGRRK